MELATPRPPRQWTPEEIALLRAWYPSMTAQQVMPMLPGRSARSIRNKAWELEIGKEIHSPKFWRPIGSERMNRGHLIRKVTDTGQPKKDWKRVDVIEWEAINGPMPEGMLLIKQPGKPRTVENLQLVPIGNFPMLAIRHNAPVEIRRLIDLKAQLGYAMARIEKMKLEPGEVPPRRGTDWTSAQKKHLAENHASCSLDELAAALGRSRRSVMRMRQNMGFASRKATRPWSNAEKQNLTAVYQTTSNPELARMFGRSAQAVSEMAARLGLRGRKRA